MAGVRFPDLQARPTAVLACTRLTLAELQQLGPPFAAACHARMAAGRLDGTPRTARRCTVEAHGPVRTPDARLVGLLASRKPAALHVVQGRGFGLAQSQAPPWRQVLFPVLRAAWRARGAAPARALPALAPRRGVAATDAAPVGDALAEAPAPVPPGPAAAPAAPLVPMPGRTGGASVPRTLRHRRHGRAASTRTTPSKMSCASRRSSSSSC
jgi:hypothetical protein